MYSCVHYRTNLVYIQLYYSRTPVYSGMYGGGGAGGPRRRDLIDRGVRGRHDADHDGDEVEKDGPASAVRARGPAAHVPAHAPAHAPGAHTSAW